MPSRLPQLSLNFENYLKIIFHEVDICFLSLKCKLYFSMSIVINLKATMKGLKAFKYLLCFTQLCDWCAATKFIKKLNIFTLTEISI